MTDAQGEIEEIQTCFLAIADLMSPDGDLQEQQRDHLAVLMDYLNRNYNRAYEKYLLSHQHTR